MDAELQRCGVCQQKKSDGAFSDGGRYSSAISAMRTPSSSSKFKTASTSLSKPPREPESVDDVTPGPRRICAGHVLGRRSGAGCSDEEQSVGYVSGPRTRRRLLEEQSWMEAPLDGNRQAVEERHRWFASLDCSVRRISSSVRRSALRVWMTVTQSSSSSGMAATKVRSRMAPRTRDLGSPSRRSLVGAGTWQAGESVGVLAGVGAIGIAHETVLWKNREEAGA